MNILSSCCSNSQSTASIEQNNNSSCLSIAFLVAAAVLALFGVLAVLKIGHFASLGQTSLYIGYGSLCASFMSMIMAVLCIPKAAPVIHVYKEHLCSSNRVLNLTINCWAKDGEPEPNPARFGISPLQFFQRALLIPGVETKRREEIAELYLKELSLLSHAPMSQVVDCLLYFDEATFDLLALKGQALKEQALFIKSAIILAKQRPLCTLLTELREKQFIGEDEFVVPAFESENGPYLALAESISMASREIVKVEDVHRDVPILDDNMNTMTNIANTFHVGVDYYSPKERNDGIQINYNSHGHNNIKLIIYQNAWISVISRHNLEYPEKDLES